MTECIKLKQSNCKNCYKCIRHCPVKSIRFEDNQAHIITSECILCGQCFVNCPQNAKQIRNDIPLVKKMIASNRPVYVSLAPSFIANYDVGCFESMEKALKQLGFKAVEETAVGATIVKKRYDEMVNNHEKDVIISSCCHTVNTLIQKKYPDLLNNLADVLSPMLAHCKVIKEKVKDAYTVFIGPCISKKAEAEEYPNYVDCVLTFEELSQWLKDENIQLEKSDNHNNYSKARLFPTSGGILKTMECKNPEYTYLAIDGIDNCIAALKDIKNGNLKNCFIEMSACYGSCINGPAMDKNHRQPVRDYLKVNSFAGTEDFKIKDLVRVELAKNMQPSKIHQLNPTNEQILEILNKMGKTTKDKELNCGSCGYDTCREKAIAVFQGKANLEMCLPFLKEKAESFSDTIITNTPNGIMVLNEMLEIQLINQAACRILNINNPTDVLNMDVVKILDPFIYAHVLTENKNIRAKKTYLAEYGKYVEETIIYDHEFHIIISIMRDITKDTLDHDKKANLSKQTIEVTNKIIEKQMRAVQEIASLLGETTAETKVALTKLKDSLKNE